MAQAGGQLVAVVNPDGSLVGSGGAAVAMDVIVLDQPVQVATTSEVNSFHGAGVVNEPDADQVIAECTPNQAGFYKIEIHRAADGTGTPSLYNTGTFLAGGDSYELSTVPELGILYNYVFYHSNDGTEPFQLIANQAASLNIAITGSVTATRIS